MLQKTYWQRFRRARLGTSHVLHATILSASALATIYIVFGICLGWTFKSPSAVDIRTAHVLVHNPGSVGPVTLYDLGVVAPGDSSTIQLVIMNTGEVTLDLAEPFTTDLPPFLTVTFTKPPPRPGFPVRIGAGESATVDMGWTFDMGYTGSGNIDFSFTVNAVATQA